MLEKPQNIYCFKPGLYDVNAKKRRVTIKLGGSISRKPSFLGSSETTRKKLNALYRDGKKQTQFKLQPSQNAPKVSAMNADQWGWFLAGLIDGDGHFNKLGYLTLVFDANSVSTAYGIKRFIGYGTVSRVSKKPTLTY